MWPAGRAAGADHRRSRWRLRNDLIITHDAGVPPPCDVVDAWFIAASCSRRRLIPLLTIARPLAGVGQLAARVPPHERHPGRVSRDRETDTALNTAAVKLTHIAIRKHASPPSDCRSLGPFYGAIAVPSVTRCRCGRCGHRFYIAIHQVSLLSHAAYAI